MKIQFTVPGEPRGKGRPRFSRSSGRAYTDCETRAYEDKIIAYYRKAHGSFRWPDTAFVSVEIVAYLPIPKSASKAAQSAMESLDTLPSRKPDVDNIEKAILDALNGVAYKDDARVYRTGCVKFYGVEPRVEITMEDYQKMR